MQYVSTRGGGEPVGFVTASLSGLAPDGGLFTPVIYPQLERPDGGWSYNAIATHILSAFAGDDLPRATVEELVAKAYASFSHESVAPLFQVGSNRWLMELHHGPTLAFKDVAMQVIGQLYDHALSERGERLTVLCATSGDTGGAAAAAFASLDSVDVIILHPYGRISPIQRRFMTSTGASNIHNLALDGDFDACQAIVKSLFATDRDALKLSGVNSINWTRIAAQSVYFAAAQAALGKDADIRFIVPTGNFGDALAAYVAARCGLLSGLDVLTAVNANRAMVDLIHHGQMHRTAAKATHSPAMDIAVPSNAERLMFEVMDRDGEAVKGVYDRFAQSGEVDLPQTAVGRLGCTGIKAVSIDDEATAEEMRTLHAETGTLQCPHTAVASYAARHAPRDGVDVILATAHAAKFPETVEALTGKVPPLPERSEAYLAKGEVFERLPADVGAVRTYIQNHVVKA